MIEEQTAVTGVARIARMGPASSMIEDSHLFDGPSLTEKRLRESEELYRALFADSPMPIWVFDNESLRFITVNEAALRMFGWSQEEFRAMTIRDVWEPEDWKAAGARLTDPASPALNALGTYRHHRKDGSVLDVEVTRRGIHYAGRAATLSLLKDVTQQRQAEKALHLKDVNLQIATDVAGLSPYSWDPATGALHWDARLKAMWGLPPNAHVDYDVWLAGVHPDDREQTVKAIERCLDPNGDGIFRAEYRVQGKDGVERWVYAVGRTLFENGKPESYSGMALDITERRRAQEALQVANQRLSYHVRNTPLAVIEFDEKLRVSAWNDGAQRIFGWEASEVVGRNLWDVPWVEEADRAVLKRVSDDLEFGRELQSVSVNRNRRKDGTLIWCEWHNSSLTDSAGRMQSIQSLVQDVTEQKKAEAILRESKVFLEELVTERTEKLQEMVNELEHFSYSITHDMRAPLRAMRSFAEMLTSEIDPPETPEEQRELLQRIVTAAARMDALIVDALKYSTTIRQDLKLTPVDVDQLLKGMLESYPNLGKSQADIVVHGPMPVVLGNEAGLTQCLSNLLTNAIKFARPGEKPHVEVRAEQRPDQWVRLWVEDNGIGIPENFRSRVFDMFVRGGHINSGTGIGLALVRKAVDRMGGRVGVESEAGQGSRFWLELKAVDGAEVSADGH